MFTILINIKTFGGAGAHAQVVFNNVLVGQIFHYFVGANGGGASSGVFSSGGAGGGSTYISSANSASIVAVAAGGGGAGNCEYKY